MNIYDTTNRLAYEIKNSDEYKNYKKLKEEIRNNPELKEKLEQFEKDIWYKELCKMNVKRFNQIIQKVYTECKKGLRGCVECKKELARQMNNFLAEIQKRRKKYEDNPELIKEILEKGTQKAKEKAEEQMKKIKQAMKIDY